MMVRRKDRIKGRQPSRTFTLEEDGWPAAFRAARKAGVSLKGFMRFGYESAGLDPDSRIKVENIHRGIDRSEKTGRYQAADVRLKKYLIFRC